MESTTDRIKNLLREAEDNTLLSEHLAKKNGPHIPREEALRRAEFWRGKATGLKAALDIVKEGHASLANRLYAQIKAD